MADTAKQSILELADEQYLLLTMFTKDGRPKPAPVWAARLDDALVVVTDSDTWKVRRLRNTARATVAPCDSRGRTRGDARPAVGTVVDGEGAARVLAAVRDKYGWQYGLVRLLQNTGRVLRRRPSQEPAGIELRDPEQPQADG